MTPDGRWAALGALATATLASACCLVPLAALALGVGGAGLGAWFGPLRPWFLAASGLLLAAGGWFLFRPAAHACCTTPAAVRRLRRNRMLFGAAGVATLLLATFPLWGTAAPEAADPVPLDGVRTVHLTVTGMTCEGCEAAVAGVLVDLPGVVDVTVSYADSSATVRVQGEGPTPEAIARGVESVGYAARPATD